MKPRVALRTDEITANAVAPRETPREARDPLMLQTEADAIVGLERK